MTGLVHQQQVKRKRLVFVTTIEEKLMFETKSNDPEPNRSNRSKGDNAGRYKPLFFGPMLAISINLCLRMSSFSPRLRAVQYPPCPQQQWTSQLKRGRVEVRFQQWVHIKYMYLFYFSGVLGYVGYQRSCSGYVIPGHRPISATERHWIDLDFVVYKKNAR